MTLITTPNSLIFITVSIYLYAKALFFIIIPISNVTIRHLPFLSPYCSILSSWSLFYPINSSMGSIFLGLNIIFLPKLHLWLVDCLRGIELRICVHILLLLLLLLLLSLTRILNTLALLVVCV